MKTDISIKTYKNLFSASANRCARPGCEAALVEPPPEGSSVRLSGRACHIYVVDEEGPRGKPGISREELDSRQNLVLLCPEHCATAVGRHESLTAAELALWKREREEEGRGTNFFESAGISADSFLKALVEREIGSAVDELRKFRFFEEVESAGYSLRLSDRLSRGDLSSGSDMAKSRAFAWCARILALEGEMGDAEKCLEAAKGLHASAETILAEAFVANGKGDTQSASETLRGIGSPESLSAALEMVWRGGGARRAVEWIKGVGIDATDLDSDGGYVLLNCQLELARWDSARVLVDVFAEECPQNTPALHYLIAITRLLRAVPGELRPALRARPPFYSEEFHLFSSEIGECEKAYEHFDLAASAAHSARCFSMAKKCEEYLFWLRLSHPEHSLEAAQRLKQKFAVPGAALHLVPLGLYFGIVPDRRAVEKEILRAAALRGRISRDAAYARVAIASRRGTGGPTPPPARERLPEELAERLRVFRGEGLSEADCVEIAAVAGDSRPSEGDNDLERRFQEADSLVALMELANELEALGRLEEFCVYGETLFERTHSLRNAERLVSAFSRTGNTGRLVGFVEKNRELLDASQRIRSLYLQALCDEGDVARLRSEMGSTADGFENPESLIDLSVFTGEWSGLGAAVSDQYSEKASSCARSLAELVGFASRLGLRGAGEIGKAAAEVLASALAAVSEAGWEENANLDVVFKEIVSLSGKEYPFPPGCARLLRADTSSESDILGKLVRGDIPLFPASRFLGKSLFDLLFLPALENLSEKDASGKRPVPARDGEKTQSDIPAGAAAGFDCTALVTLGFLSLLDEAFDTFDEVFVTHSTLAWLFAEKVNASFCRREQAKDARALSRLLERGRIEEFDCRGASNAGLSLSIGQDLASMIEEAGRGGDGRRLIVRSAPVYRTDSLVKEQVDLAEHSDVLVSCSSVAAVLREKGILTAEAEQRACVYLRLLGTPWPREPEIADGSRLYLDAASAACFLRLGILGKLKCAGFRVFIPRTSLSETEFLLSYEKNSEEISACIERVRSVLSSRMESGKVRVGRRLHTATPENCLVHGNTVSGLRALADICDVIVSDDGFFKGRGSAWLSAQTLSTPDILSVLASSGIISSRQLRQCRDRLKNAGYPVPPQLAYS